MPGKKLMTERSQAASFHISASWSVMQRNEPPLLRRRRLAVLRARISADRIRLIREAMMRRHYDVDSGGATGVTPFPAVAPSRAEGQDRAY